MKFYCCVSGRAHFLDSLTPVLEQIIWFQATGTRGSPDEAHFAKTTPSLGSVPVESKNPADASPTPITLALIRSPGANQRDICVVITLAVFSELL